MGRKQEQTRDFTFIRPVNRTKVRERLQEGAGRLLEEFGREVDDMLAEAGSWSPEDWMRDAGLYADLKAVRRYVVDEDCFGFYEKGKDGKKHVRQGIEEGFGLASRFLKRLMKEGARMVARTILESYKLDASWQARSGDRMDLAQLLLIDG